MPGDLICSLNLQAALRMSLLPPEREFLQQWLCGIVDLRLYQKPHVACNAKSAGASAYPVGSESSEVHEWGSRLLLANVFAHVSAPPDHYSADGINCSRKGNCKLIVLWKLSLLWASAQMIAHSFRLGPR